MPIAYPEKHHETHKGFKDILKIMSNELKHLIHGRETYIADFGPDFVMKRPLPPALKTMRIRLHLCETKSKHLEIWNASSQNNPGITGIFFYNKPNLVI